jgi:hypothetical protein
MAALTFKYIQTQHIQASSSLAYSKGKNEMLFLYLGQVELVHSTSNCLVQDVYGSESILLQGNSV